MAGTRCKRQCAPDFVESDYWNVMLLCKQGGDSGPSGYPGEFRQRVLDQSYGKVPDLSASEE